MPKISLCPSCGSFVSSEAKTCPKCGYPLKSSVQGMSPFKLFFVIVMAIIFAVLLLSIGE